MEDEARIENSFEVFITDTAGDVFFSDDFHIIFSRREMNLTVMKVGSSGELLKEKVSL